MTVLNLEFTRSLTEPHNSKDLHRQSFPGRNLGFGCNFTDVRFATETLDANPSDAQVKENSQTSAQNKVTFKCLEFFVWWLIFQFYTLY